MDHQCGSFPAFIIWKKYGQNPIMEQNKSSGILVHDGEKYRLYTMRPEVAVHFPAPGTEGK